MSDNKVVIKINYDRNLAEKPKAEPRTITVWHTRRIVAALAALVLLLAILYSWLSGDDQASDNQIALAEKVPVIDKAEVNTVGPEAPSDSNNIASPISPAQEIHQESVKKSDANKKPGAIIFDRRVIRASLNGKPRDNEPGDPIKSPLRVAANQSAELFYFSEIKDMKGKALYHQWRRNGQLVYQKQLDLKDKISKVWSSKLLSAKDKGEWQVQLSDKKSKVYSEVNFVVNPE